MATAETADLGPSHFPLHESIHVFQHLEKDLKISLQHHRHEQSKHEPEFFEQVKDLSDHELISFSADDLSEVRVGSAAYGKHLLGKVRLPKSNQGTAYFQFRAFVPGGPETATLHCIRMDEIREPDGNKRFKAIFSQDDALEWFNE